MVKAQKNTLPIDQETLKQSLPSGPGVYLFKDGVRVIYVGKAKNLKKRVLSYFRSNIETSSKTKAMMDRAKGLDYILTITENEAFILEHTLIKKHMPRYNVVLRDDKRYPFLRFGVKDQYPQLTIVRRMKKDGAIYFGPFSSTLSVRSTLKLIDRIFQLRKCKTGQLPKRSRPCLNFQLGRCLGPCTNNVSEDAYNKIVEQVRLFLEGRNRELIRKMKEEMSRLADQFEFEDAARIRDQIRAVEKTIEHQDVVSNRAEDQDVIGLSCAGEEVQIVILHVRKGYLIGRHDFSLDAKGATNSEIMESFIKQYYRRNPFIPKNILISDYIDDHNPISGWLSEMAGKKIHIIRPIKGEKARILHIAITNAENLLVARKKSGKQDLMELARSALRLKKRPETIEGLDISNILGNQAVGTVVSFKEGDALKSGYRNYRIKEVDGIDDYGMMSELIKRRLSQDILPDLFVVDGGKGHLSVVKNVIDNTPLEESPDVVAIAKADENLNEDADKIFLPGRKNPVSLRKDHPVLMLLMRIRDEAHRRAITYHRKLRTKSMKESMLDQIPGIGPKKKKSLMQYFNSADSIHRAGVKELTLVPGISKALAKRITRFFFEADTKGSKE